MRLPVRVNGVEGYVVGYGPGPHGEPVAMVVIKNSLLAVPLNQIEVTDEPKKPKAVRQNYSYGPVDILRGKSRDIVDAISKTYIKNDLPS